MIRKRYLSKEKKKFSKNMNYDNCLIISNFFPLFFHRFMKLIYKFTLSVPPSVSQSVRNAIRKIWFARLLFKMESRYFQWWLLWPVYTNLVFTLCFKRWKNTYFLDRFLWFSLIFLNVPFLWQRNICSKIQFEHTCFYLASLHMDFVHPCYLN